MKAFIPELGMLVDVRNDSLICPLLTGHRRPQRILVYIICTEFLRALTLPHSVTPLPVTSTRIVHLAVELLKTVHRRLFWYSDSQAQYLFTILQWDFNTANFIYPCYKLILGFENGTRWFWHADIDHHGTSLSEDDLRGKTHHNCKPGKAGFVDGQKTRVTAFPRAVSLAASVMIS